MCLAQTSSLTCTERYHNLDDLKVLLNIDTSQLPDDFESFITDKEQTKLKGLMKGSKKHKDGYKCKTITFKKKVYGKVGPYGRLIADRSSLQSCWKFARTIICEGEIKGFDLSNSQPRILKQLCDRYIPHKRFKNLDEYCNNRDSKRSEIADHYSVSTDIAKELMVRLCFGGSIQKWRKDFKVDKSTKDMDFVLGFYNDVQSIMNMYAKEHFEGYQKAIDAFEHLKQIDPTGMKHKKRERTALALYLQNIEGDIILTMADALKKQGIQVLTPIHDELNVLASDVQGKTDQIMRSLEKAVLDVLNFQVNLKLEDYVMTEKYKTMLDNHKKFEVIIPDEPDDVINGNRLYELMKGRCNLSKELGKFMYDDQSGIWVTDADEMMRIVYRFQSEFIQTKETENGRKISYSRDFGNMVGNIMKQFWMKVPKSDPIDSDNNRGYLLFNNGVLDCYEFKMLPFDQKYHFTKKICRDFNPDSVSQEIVDDLKQRIFESAYTDGSGDTTKMDYFMEILSIALMEGSVDKKMMTMLGETDCGKGVLTQLLSLAFGEYVSFFNTNILLKGTNANIEDASQWRFLIPCYDTRLMIGNEIAVKCEEDLNGFGKREKREVPFNIDMIKTLVGGGDAVKARGLFKDEVKIINKAFVMILANDMPKTSSDPAYIKRQLIMNAYRSSTSDEVFDKSMFFKADTTIKDWIKRVDVRDAMITLMCRTYRRYKLDRSPVPDWIKMTVSEYVESSSASSWVHDNYEVYKGDVLKDFDGVEGENGIYRFNWDKVGEWALPADVMFKVYKDTGGRDSSTKFGRMLTANKVFAAVKKRGGRAVRYRVGVRVPIEDDDGSYRMIDSDDC
jgi:hypothetical protein